MTDILVLYYSHSGSVARLARQIARGIAEVPNGRPAAHRTTSYCSHPSTCARRTGRWRTLRGTHRLDRMQPAYYSEVRLTSATWQHP